MKANHIKHNGRRKTIVLGTLVLILAAGAGIIFGYSKLRDLWLEQCVIRDVTRQVEISSGRMVQAGLLAERLGLVQGANLALIDFEDQREHILAEIPNLKDLRIRRHLPDRVTITTEERIPVARLGRRGQSRTSGRVVDSEGVVFSFIPGTRALPLIRDTSEPADGSRLPIRAQSALQLIEACHDPKFQDLGVQDVDVTHPDYLLATISTGARYIKLKLAWEGMDEPPTPASQASLERQLRHFKQALEQGLESAVDWNATDYAHPSRVYADTKGKF